MANYCSNTISITGDNVEVVLDFIRDGDRDISFQKIIPLNKGDDKYEKWGAGCEAQDDSYYSSIDDSGVNFVCFETRWDTVRPIADALKTRFPNNDFLLEYHEPNERIKGSYLGRIK